MNSNPIELLAPAGGKDPLKAAVYAGADAVYLAGRSFGARSGAQNFDDDELAEAIRFCHRHGVSVYAAVNTLILDEELEAVLRFVDFLYYSDVDAVIVQDLGLMHEIRRRYPDLALHASTQMTFHNVEGVCFAKELGFSRVVLPREMTVQEIRQIASEVDIELEVFVHGALCVSYSGMCLLSSFIGGRSGNRGSCAQPCRKKYQLYSLDAERSYHTEYARLISPKDLSVIEYLDELRSIPKLSLKIEGRLKGYDYVYHVVSQYRQVLDGKQTPEEAAKQLQKSYHRGHTKGFLFSEDIVDFTAGLHTGNRGTLLGSVIHWRDGMLTIRLSDSLSKGDEVQHRFHDGTSVGARADRILRDGRPVSGAEAGDTVTIPFKHRLRKGDGLYKTYDVSHIGQIDQALNGEHKVWSIRFHVQARKGAPIRLYGNVGSIDETVVGEIVEEAMQRGTGRDRIIEQIGKLGGTPFQPDLENSVFEVDDDAFVPIRELNALRRTLIEAITARLEIRYPERISRPAGDVQEERGIATEAEPMRQMLSKRQRANAPRAMAEESGMLRLPAVIPTSSWDRYQRMVDEAAAVRIGHVSQLAFRGLEQKYIVAAHSVNALNAASADFLLRCGVDRVELSTEVDFAGQGSPFTVLTREGICAGSSDEPTILMRMAYCPIGATFGGGRSCGLCKKYRFALKDEMGEVFELDPDPSTCMTGLLAPVAKKGKRIQSNQNA